MNALEVFRIWLYRSGHEIVIWWLLVTLAGLAAWPLMYRLMRRLPDRGYALARPAGMLLTTFTLWFLGSLGMLRNDTGSIILAWLIVLALGTTAYFKLHAQEEAPVDMGTWLRTHWRFFLGVQFEVSRRP